MTSDHTPIDAIDKMHEEVVFLSDVTKRGVDDSLWWVAVGDWLDLVKPLTFYRNTGKLRESTMVVLPNGEGK